MALVLADVFILAGAYVAAFWLRVGADGLAQHRDVILQTLPILILVSLPLHLKFGLFNAVLRYASIDTAVAVLKAVTLSVGVSALLMFLIFRLEGVPRSVFVIYFMTALLAVGASRLVVRVLKGGARSLPKENARRILLYGAGDNAAMAIRGLRAISPQPYEAVGLIDDDPALKGQALLGMKVLGGQAALGEAARSTGASELWVCVPDLAGEKLRAVFRAASDARLRVKILPRLEKSFIASDLAQLREPNVADLLRRPARQLDRDRQRAWVQGRRVLITGAGGSIGSELARQVSRLGPEVVALCDVGESALFEIDRELSSRQGRDRVKPYLVDCKDESAVGRMVGDVRPDIVFHAAAFKHVPMVELNPCEGVLNNVLGLWNVSRAAREAGAGYFVFVSTDKAVRPASVMGATKRLGEMLMQSLSREGRTRFMAVRFGNVLGSSGSAIPIFQEQIRRGGPVTVTHPEMTRYFMLVSEAVELVIQAGSMGGGGEVFILDMGEPIRIVDLARDLIRLMGKEPEVDVKIEFVGVRPGEKIHEELLISPDSKKTSLPDIWLDAEPPRSLVAQSVERIFEASRSRDRAATLRLLREVVASFAPVFEATREFAGDSNGQHAAAAGRSVAPATRPVA